MSSGPQANGIAAIRVAVIDGPYDPIALSGVLARQVVSVGDATCHFNPNNGCKHGTFIMGLLGARRDALIPGICPGCSLLHIPLFADETTPVASVGELAKAITIAVAAGANLINLSLAILGDSLQSDHELIAALDYAAASGSVVLAAAGNQGRLAMGQLLSHPVTVPVVAMDATRRLVPDCNSGFPIARRGVAAPGHQVLGYAPGGGTTVMSGTSVATAVAIGTLGLLWSMRPNADGFDIRSAVANFAPRNGWIPPMLDLDSLLETLDHTLASTFPKASPAQWARPNYAIFQGETIMKERNGLDTPPNSGGELAASSISTVSPAQRPAKCACAAPGGICTCQNGALPPTRFIYVLGTVDIRFPDQSISEELESVARTMNIKQSADEPLRHYYYRVLSLRTDTGMLMARHVARQVCWILKVEGQPAYYLALRDLQDLPDLVNCLDHPEGDDLDLFVGTSSTGSDGGVFRGLGAAFDS